MRRGFLILAALLLGGVLGSYGSTRFLEGRNAAPSSAVPRELTSYRDVARKVLPAVVSIEARGKPRRGAEGQRDDLPPVGFGSGFLVDPKGVVLTNYHVVEDADSFEVQLLDGRKFVSKDVKADPKSDLAILRIDAREPLPFLEFGDSAAMEIGDRVLAAGAPFGLKGSVTAGIVSAKGRSLHLNNYEDFLQTDAAVNPGNSGGPLVNLEGKVVGVTAAIKSRNGGFQGVGLAVASNLAKDVADKLLKDGVVRRGYLGVQIRDVDAELAAKLGLREPAGVLLTLVNPDTPAAKAGFVKGDVLVGLAGKTIRDGHELQGVVAGLPVGKAVEAVVLRDGKRKALPVVIEEQPRDFGTK